MFKKVVSFMPILSENDYVKDGTRRIETYHDKAHSSFT